MGTLSSQSRQVSHVLTHQIEVLNHLERGVESTSARVVHTSDRVAKLDS